MEKFMTEVSGGNVNVVLYPEFTALDVFGPVEVLCNIEGYSFSYLSLNGGVICNRQGLRIETVAMREIENSEIVIIPGGFGSRTVINDAAFIRALGDLIKRSKYVICVCTGSALAAATGLLNGRNATTNKMAFEWVKNCGPAVIWNRNARWVRDENIYTSAGVSAGTDMAVGFVRDRFGEEKAKEICALTEYHWNSDADHDTF